MNKIQFTALKYYNSFISDECLYIGMLYNNLTTGEVTFSNIKNFKRLATFDDEIDIDFVKLYLAGIKNEVESRIYNYNKPFELSNYIKTFVNSFRFSEIKYIETNDVNAIENLNKIYLKFDYAKTQRLNSDTETAYIKQLFISSNVKFDSKPLVGHYNENINYDYKTNNFAIKIFHFKDKNLKKMINTAKSWSFNALEMKDYYKTIFIYDLEIENQPAFETIINILSENAHKVLPINAGQIGRAHV